MESFIKHCKTLIDEGNLDELQALFQEVQEENYAWEYVYQKVYLHACLKKKMAIVEWMTGLFSMFDPNRNPTNVLLWQIPLGKVKNLNDKYRNEHSQEPPERYHA